MNNSDIINSHNEGVYVHEGLNKFIMNGGTISNSYSNGVCVLGHFEMNEGTISGNDIKGIEYNQDAEVNIWPTGTFIMNGGTIIGRYSLVLDTVIKQMGCTFVQNGGTIKVKD